MDFSQIQFQTSLNIDLFIKNYLARYLRQLERLQTFFQKFKSS